MRLLVGDSLVRLKELADCSVDAVVTDPPYGIRFIGNAWDGADIIKMAADRSKYHGDEAARAGVRGGHKSVAAQAGKYDLSINANKAFQEWTEVWALEVYRVLKPGGHCLSFASTRTYHRMTSGIEDAGFEIRDQIGWVFGSGFPKSHNLHGEWEGWGTALKPAWEPIVVARKPLIGTVVSNVLTHGTGAINIDGCRVPGEPVPINKLESWSGFEQTQRPDYTATINDQGRWPANLIHDGSDEVLAAFPAAPGQIAKVKYDSSLRQTSRVYSSMKRGHEPTANKRYTSDGVTNFAMTPGARRLDAGSAARFFYCAKTSKSERGADNSHPTVKPLALMRYLVRLVTPPRGLILDPFLGSGTTGCAALAEGFDFIGIEREPAYFDIAKRRICEYLPKPVAGEPVATALVPAAAAPATSSPLPLAPPPPSVQP